MESELALILPVPLKIQLVIDQNADNLSKYTHSLFDTNENIFSAAESCTFHSFLSFDKINHCALKCIDENSKVKYGRYDTEERIQSTMH